MFVNKNKSDEYLVKRNWDKKKHKLKQIRRYCSTLECESKQKKNTNRTKQKIWPQHWPTTPQRHIKNKQMNKINAHKLLFAMAICQTNEYIVGHCICLWCGVCASMRKTELETSSSLVHELPMNELCRKRERDIQTGVLLAYIAAHYLFIVASDCSSRFSKKLKYRDRQIGHLWILFAYSSFLSFVPFSLVWLTCRFHHRNCLHSFYLLLFYYDTQINVVKLPFAIDPQPDSWVESQLHRWRTLEAINGLLERKK